MPDDKPKCEMYVYHDDAVVKPCNTIGSTHEYRIAGGVGIVTAQLCAFHKAHLSWEHPEWKFVQVDN